MCCPRLGSAPALCGAGADQVALHVRQAAQHGQHQPPSASTSVGPRLGQRPESRPGIGDPFHDAEQVEGGARQAINPRHHHVAGGELFSIF
jgi:hypothetical protein